MNIKKAAILGAGAVGSYVIWGLSNKDGIELGVVAKDERNKRLKNKGITINGISSGSVGTAGSARCRLADRVSEIWFFAGRVGQYKRNRWRTYHRYELDEWRRQ